MTDLVDIQPTSKGEKYLVPSDDKQGAYFSTYQYELDEVTRVHEMPSFNVAEVDVKFKVKKKTPFAQSDNGDRYLNPTRKFTFQKTSNGWEFCDGRKQW